MRLLLTEATNVTALSNQLRELFRKWFAKSNWIWFYVVRLLTFCQIDNNKAKGSRRRRSELTDIIQTKSGWENLLILSIFELNFKSWLFRESLHPRRRSSYEKTLTTSRFPVPSKIKVVGSEGGENEAEMFFFHIALKAWKWKEKPFKAEAVDVRARNH